MPAGGRRASGSSTPKRMRSALSGCTSIGIVRRSSGPCHAPRRDKSGNVLDIKETYSAAVELKL